jgi:hypothetical protein
VKRAFSTRPSPSLFKVVTLACVCVIGGACASGPTVEGYPVGDKLCDGVTGAKTHDDDIACAALSSTAHDMLPRGHAAVISDETYEDGYGIHRTYGSGHAQGVVVLQLGDLTTHAFFLGCVMGPYGTDPPKGGPCGRMKPMPGESWRLPNRSGQ